MNAGVSQQLRKHVTLFPVILINRIRDALIRKIATAVNQDDANQFPGLLHSHRAQKVFVDHAERRCIRANAERQGEHRNHREAGILQQLAEGKAHVVHGFAILDLPFGIADADCEPAAAMNQLDLKNRTKKFALRVLKLVTALPKSPKGGQWAVS
jgi:hypothetical protein